MCDGGNDGGDGDMCEIQSEGTSFHIVSEICERFNLAPCVFRGGMRWCVRIRQKIPTGFTTVNSLALYSILQAGCDMGHWIDFINICRLLRMRLSAFFRYSKKVENVLQIKPLDLRSFQSLIGYVRSVGVISESETLEVQNAYLRLIEKTDMMPNYALTLVLYKYRKFGSCRQVCRMLNTNYRRVQNMVDSE